MNPALGEIGGGPDVALPASLLKISSIDHRLWIGGRQDVVHSVAAGAIRRYFRSELRSQSVVAGLVTTYAFAGNAKLLRQGHALVTLGAAFGSNCGRRDSAGLFKRDLDVVNAMAIGAYRCARNTSRHGLTMYARGKFLRFALMALTAGSWNVDFE